MLIQKFVPLKGVPASYIWYHAIIVQALAALAVAISIRVAGTCLLPSCCSQVSLPVFVD